MCPSSHRCVFFCVLHNDAETWGHLRICQTWRKKYICSFYIRIQLCCGKVPLPKYILKLRFWAAMNSTQILISSKSSWETDYRKMSWALIKCKLGAYATVWKVAVWNAWKAQWLRTGTGCAGHTDIWGPAWWWCISVGRPHWCLWVVLLMLHSCNLFLLAGLVGIFSNLHL